MNYESFIALRYFRAKRRTGFISIITYVSVIGVIIGVAALDVVLAVFNGFEAEVRTRLLNADAHIRISKYHTDGIRNYQEIIDSVRTIPRVKGVSPTIDKQTIIFAKGNNNAVVIRALDPETAAEVSEVPKSIYSGAFNLGSGSYQGKEMPGIVLGRYFAESLDILEEGERVVLYAFSEKGSWMQLPRAQQFVVTGISEIGFYEYDKIFAYISLKEAQKLFRLPEAVTSIEVRLDNYEMAEQVTPQIEAKIGTYPFAIRTWFEQNKSLYSWMAYEKLLFTLLLSLIIMVAAFNIISSLIMIVMEKTREIGILKSIGASSRGIMRIFLLEGIFIGVLGTVFGTLLAWVICYVQEKFGLVRMPAEVYIIDKLPVKIQLLDFGIVTVIGLSLCLLAAVYPAYKASRLDPVDAIRYE